MPQGGRVAVAQLHGVLQAVQGFGGIALQLIEGSQTAEGRGPGRAGGSHLGEQLAGQAQVLRFAFPSGGNDGAGPGIAPERAVSALQAPDVLDQGLHPFLVTGFEQQIEEREPDLHVPRPQGGRPGPQPPCLLAVAGLVINLAKARAQPDPVVCGETVNVFFNLRQGSAGIHPRGRAAARPVMGPGQAQFHAVAQVALFGGAQNLVAFLDVAAQLGRVGQRQPEIDLLGVRATGLVQQVLSLVGFVLGRQCLGANNGYLDRSWLRLLGLVQGPVDLLPVLLLRIETHVPQHKQPGQRGADRGLLGKEGAVFAERFVKAAEGHESGRAGQPRLQQAGIVQSGLPISRQRPVGFAALVITEAEQVINLGRELRVGGRQRPQPHQDGKGLAPLLFTDQQARL